MHVAYKGGSEAALAVVTKDVDFSCGNLTSAIGLIKGGKLKAIASAREKRSVLLPDLPSAAETPGFEGFGINSWVGFFGIGGTPKPIIDGLSAATRKVLTKPDIKARFDKISAELEPSTPDEFRQFIIRQTESWAKKVKDAGIQPE